MSAILHSWLRRRTSLTGVSPLLSMLPEHLKEQVRYVTIQVFAHIRDNLKHADWAEEFASKCEM